MDGQGFTNDDEYTVPKVVATTSVSAPAGTFTDVACTNLNGVLPYLDPLDTKGDILVYGTKTDKLPVGSDGQVLTADSAESKGVKWTTPTTGFANPLSNKGDIFTRTVSSNYALPVGSDGQVLTADAASTGGIKWSTPSTGTLSNNNVYSLGLVRANSQYASIADGLETGLDFNGDFTVEAYVNLFSAPSATAQYGILGRWSSSGSTTKAWAVMIENNAGTMGLRCDVTSNGTTNDSLRVPMQVPNGTWVHLAFVYVLADKKLYGYMNGVLIGASAAGTHASIQTSVGPCYLGSKYDATHFLDGLIGYCRAWNVARTQAQIAANMNVQLTTATNLVGNWTLQNNYNDASGNSNNMTSSGSPVFTRSIPFNAYTLT